MRIKLEKESSGRRRLPTSMLTHQDFGEFSFSDKCRREVNLPFLV